MIGTLKVVVILFVRMKKGNQNSQTTQIYYTFSSVLSQHQQVYPDIESRNLDTTDKNIIHIIHSYNCNKSMKI